MSQEAYGEKGISEYSRSGNGNKSKQPELVEVLPDEDVVDISPTPPPIPETSADRETRLAAEDEADGSSLAKLKEVAYAKPETKPVKTVEVAPTPVVEKTATVSQEVDKTKNLYNQLEKTLNVIKELDKNISALEDSAGFFSFGKKRQLTKLKGERDALKEYSESVYDEIKALKPQDSKPEKVEVNPQIRKELEGLYALNSQIKQLDKSIGVFSFGKRKQLRGLIAERNGVQTNITSLLEAEGVNPNLFSDSGLYEATNDVSVLNSLKESKGAKALATAALFGIGAAAMKGALDAHNTNSSGMGGAETQPVGPKANLDYEADTQFMTEADYDDANKKQMTMKRSSRSLGDSGVATVGGKRVKYNLGKPDVVGGKRPIPVDGPLPATYSDGIKIGDRPVEMGVTGDSQGALKVDAKGTPVYDTNTELPTPAPELPEQVADQAADDAPEQKTEKKAAKPEVKMSNAVIDKISNTNLRNTFFNPDGGHDLVKKMTGGEKMVYGFLKKILKFAAKGDKAGADAETHRMAIAFGGANADGDQTLTDSILDGDPWNKAVMLTNAGSLKNYQDGLRTSMAAVQDTSSTNFVVDTPNPDADRPDFSQPKNLVVKGGSEANFHEDPNNPGKVDKSAGM